MAIKKYYTYIKLCYLQLHHSWERNYLVIQETHIQLSNLQLEPEQNYWTVEYYLYHIYNFIHGTVCNLERVPGVKNHVMVLPHVQRRLDPMESKHENGYILKDRLSALDISSHCSAASFRISRRHLFPREGVRKME